MGCCAYYAGCLLMVAGESEGTWEHINTLHPLDFHKKIWAISTQAQLIIFYPSQFLHTDSFFSFIHPFSSVNPGLGYLRLSKEIQTSFSSATPCSSWGSQDISRPGVICNPSSVLWDLLASQGMTCSYRSDDTVTKSIFNL